MSVTPYGVEHHVILKLTVLMNTVIGNKRLIASIHTDRLLPLVVPLSDNKIKHKCLEIRFIFKSQLPGPCYELVEIVSETSWAYLTVMLTEQAIPSLSYLYPKHHCHNNYIVVVEILVFVIFQKVQRQTTHHISEFLICGS